MGPFAIEFGGITRNSSRCTGPTERQQKVAEVRSCDHIRLPSGVRSGSAARPCVVLASEPAGDGCPGRYSVPNAHAYGDGYAFAVANRDSYGHGYSY